MFYDIEWDVFNLTINPITTYIVIPSVRVFFRSMRIKRIENHLKKLHKDHQT